MVLYLTTFFLGGVLEALFGKDDLDFFDSLGGAEASRGFLPGLFGKVDLEFLYKLGGAEASLAFLLVNDAEAGTGSSVVKPGGGRRLFLTNSMKSLATCSLGNLGMSTRTFLMEY